MREIKFIDEHECDILKKYEGKNIRISKCDVPNTGQGWFWIKDNILDGIAFCPYCGTKLEEKERAPK